jgi:uncharacterized protein YcbK (DUF882 family)
MTWKFFKFTDFACKHCNENRMSREFVDSLDELRNRSGFPFIVNSGYRCPIHNQNVSSTGPNGPHTTGMAVDIRCTGPQAFIILEHLFAMNREAKAKHRKPPFTGVGVSQKGSSRFVHIDCINAPPRPNIWSY